MKKKQAVQRKRPIKNSAEVERFAQKSKLIYEDIRWRFIINLVILALILLMLSQVFIYDELVKSVSPEKLELGETILSMFIIFDLLLVIRYVPDKVAFLKKNWIKAVLVLPNWIVVKPFNLIGIDSLIPNVLSQSGITQAGRSINIFDSARDLLDKL